MLNVLLYPYSYVKLHCVLHVYIIWSKPDIWRFENIVTYPYKNLKKKVYPTMGLSQEKEIQYFVEV